MAALVRKARWFWPVFGTILLADCSTKELIVSALEASPGPHPVIGDVLRFSLAYNPGAALSLSFGSASRLVFAGFACVALVFLFRLYLRTPAQGARRATALALVAGGALGNLLDRIRSARGVVDFIDVGIGNARLWTFNIADIGVITGALLLAFVLWREEQFNEQPASPSGAAHGGQVQRGSLWLLALAMLGVPLAAQSPSGQNPPGRITRAGVARAQGVVDSVFLDRIVTEGLIEGGDWASYLMARLGVEPLPEASEILIAVDSARIVLSGRLQDLPAEARTMIGPLAALVDSSTVLAAEIAQLPASAGLAHFRLQGVSIGGVPVPEIILRAMLLNVGDQYPALTKSGRDLFVEIPKDARVMLVAGAVKLTAPPKPPGSEPSGGLRP